MAWRDEFRDEVLSLIRDVVRQAGVETRTTVDMDEGSPSPDGAPTIIYLRPANPKAAELGIQLDHEAQVTFYVGRHATVAEEFNRDRAELLDAIRSYVLLAISGNYHEYVRDLEGRPRHQAISRFTWPDDGQPGGFSYNVLLPRRWSSLARKGWTEELYETY